MGQVHVVVDDQMKERWQWAVSEFGVYDSVSDLVRTAVSKELEGGHEVEEEDVMMHLARIEDTMDGYYTLLNDMDEDVARQVQDEIEIDVQSNVETVIEAKFDELIEAVREGNDV